MNHGKMHARGRFSFTRGRRCHQQRSRRIVQVGEQNGIAQGAHGFFVRVCCMPAIIEDQLRPGRQRAVFGRLTSWQMTAPRLYHGQTHLTLQYRVLCGFVQGPGWCGPCYPRRGLPLYPKESSSERQSQHSAGRWETPASAPGAPGRRGGWNFPGTGVDARLIDLPGQLIVQGLIGVGIALQ